MCTLHLRKVKAMDKADNSSCDSIQPRIHMNSLNLLNRNDCAVHHNFSLIKTLWERYYCIIKLPSCFSPHNTKYRLIFQNTTSYIIRIHLRIKSSGFFYLFIYFLSTLIYIYASSLIQKERRFSQRISQVNRSNSRPLM